MKRAIAYLHAHRKAIVAGIGASLTALATSTGQPGWIAAAAAFTVLSTGAVPNAPA